MKKSNSVLKWALIAGIIIVLNLFFHVAIETVYEAPAWDDFCGQGQMMSAETEAQCRDVGGKWMHRGVEVEPSVPAPTAPNEEMARGFCDTSGCRENFDEARASYQKNVFVVRVVLGVLSILVGVFAAAYPAVAAGLSFGGVLSLIIASFGYWSEADNLVRLLILGGALTLLVFIGVKRFKE